MYTIELLVGNNRDNAHGVEGEEREASLNSAAGNLNVISRFKIESFVAKEQSDLVENRIFRFAPLR